MHRYFEKKNGYETILINYCVIEFVEKVRNLGLMFNRNLRTDHINSIIGKVYGMLRTLRDNQFYTPIKIITLLAKAYYLPALMYRCEIYANCSDKYKLNLLYNNITRYVYRFKKYDHVSVLSVKIFSMTFEDLLKYRTLLFLQKIISSKEPSFGCPMSRSGSMKLRRRRRKKHLVYIMNYVF